MNLTLKEKILISSSLLGVALLAVAWNISSLGTASTIPPTTKAESCFVEVKDWKPVTKTECYGCTPVFETYIAFGCIDYPSEREYKQYYREWRCDAGKGCRWVTGWRWETRTIIATACGQPIPTQRQVRCDPNCVKRTSYEEVIKKVPVPCVSCQSKCSPNQCWSGTETRACQDLDGDGCYKWGPNINNCAATVGGSCINGKCVVSRPDTGFSGSYGARQESKGCIDVKVGLNSPNSKSITVSEGTPFVVRFSVNPAACPGKRGPNKPIKCVGEGTWRGQNLSTGGEERRLPGFSGTAPLNYNGGDHDYGATCYLATEGGGTISVSDSATVHYRLNLSKPDTCSNIDGIQSKVPDGMIKVGGKCLTPQPDWVCPGVRPSCETNECVYNQCWNINQTRPCAKDYNTGNSCWCEPIRTCDPGSHCSGEQCIDDKTGEPRMPNGDKTKADEKEIDWDKLLKELNKTDTGTDNNGGAGGAGFPAFGSTQCYDGKDNDNDAKIDNGVTKVENGVKKYYPPDPGCQDKDGKYDPNDKFEFQYRIKEVIPDFFNLNWFRLDFSVVDITSAVI